MSLAGSRTKCACEDRQQINRSYPTRHSTAGAETKNCWAGEGEQKISKPDQTPMQIKIEDLITGNQNSDGILVGPLRLESQRTITYDGRNGERKKWRWSLIYNVR
jgi:hypothetical protein